MIRAGHAGAWDYPLGVYLAAVDELKETNNGGA